LDGALSNSANQLVSITRGRGIRYPSPADHSPSETFPEYPFGRTKLSSSNEVYGLVRQCLRDFGCDEEYFGTSRWNPLGTWIQKGQRVVVLPNFVVHRRPWESLERFSAKCTHSSVLRAVMDYAMIATGDPALVSFGNAPLQGCDHERVAAETGATSLSAFYSEVAGVDPGPHDFRLLKSRWTNFGAQTGVEELSQDDAISIDLGGASWLEELYANRTDVHVRVGDYPPSKTEACHGKGKHVYIINRRVLEADVIISVPKLKTHEKVGITCALKGTVGTIARKECLAHHRLGSPERNGDEFPSAGFFRDLSSNMSETACTLGTDVGANAYRVASKVLNRVVRLGPNGVSYGAWHGNDTAWRMALDIARLLRFGRIDGSIAEHPVRSHLALVDGVVAGEGEGPLAPRARECGAILFGPDVCAVDHACARVMGFDPQRIKLVHHSFSRVFPTITDSNPSEIVLRLNGQAVQPEELSAAFSPGFRPPKGWVGEIEWSGPDRAADVDRGDGVDARA
jgi:uncharacterized protein (DUF362 family)